MASSKRSSAAIRGPDVLAPLREIKMVAALKPVLPAELMAMILDVLPVADLVRFAGVSRRMREMVYDDTRWIQRLRSMGCWNESEARQRFEQSMRRRLDGQRVKEPEESRRTSVGRGEGANASAATGTHSKKGSMTLFDSAWEEQRQVLGSPTKARVGSADLGYDATALSANYPSGPATGISPDQLTALNVLKNIRSVRGAARQEYGKVYQALAPLYYDLVQSKIHDEAAMFNKYTDPQDQAQILANLKTFAHSDWAQGWLEREQRLDSMTGIFENALLREFEQSCDSRDFDGGMKRYAHVLAVLNRGTSAIDCYIQHHRLMREKGRFGNPLRCLEGVAPGHADLGPSEDFFQQLSRALNEDSVIIDRVFPSSVDVFAPFLDRIGEDIISEYTTSLFDEAHNVNIETYLKAVSGVLEQGLHFVSSLQPPAGSKNGFAEKMLEMITRIFEPHIDLYLAEEIHFFRSKCYEEVDIWEKKLSEQEASAESFFMSNVNRQAEKRDFLTSFKKVVMMPVNVLPTKQASAKPTVESKVNGASEAPSRSSTPGLSVGHTVGRSVTPSHEAPTTELAAKAALMNSKLEGIRLLFSIEIALNLVHGAKSSIDRAACFVKLGGQWSDEAKVQCETLFVDLLDILGFRHIKPGFDKAVGHLSRYNPREIGTHSQAGVEPLVTFLELVHVGDLIQQMVDVFYGQELVAKKLTDPDDFLDPAVKEKKRFEQMLDERVAAGLNKGIDVLMDEVEYLCATTQAATDFNPGDSSDTHATLDIGPTKTAVQIADLVSSHTSMLVGSTDKNMLDVFNSEVGVRLFTAICKHIKRQRISTDGAIKLISDTNHYFNYIQTLKNKELLPYFSALRELSQIFLIAPTHAKEIATIIADGDRYHGVFRAEEVYEFAERRADWYQIRYKVEKAMYGIGCSVM